MGKISEDLRATLRVHPEITEVHFSAKGKHHFNVYPHGGSMYGRILTTSIIDQKTNKPVQVQAPVLESRIVETVSAEAILDSNDSEVSGESFEAVSSKKKAKNKD